MKKKELFQYQDQIGYKIFDLKNISFSLKIANGEYLYVSSNFSNQLKGFLKVKNVVGKVNSDIFVKRVVEQLQEETSFNDPKNKNHYSIKNISLESKKKLRTLLFIKFKITQFPLPILEKKIIVGTIIIDADSQQAQLRDCSSGKKITPTKFSQLIREMKKVIQNSSPATKNSNEKFKKLIPQLEKISNRDFLTGLFNRNNFEEILQLEVKKSIRFKYPINLLIIDVDDFKRVNDNYGHLCGDAVLKDLSKVFIQTVRETDYVCRWGGEEFVVLLPKCDREDAQNIAEKLIVNTRKKAFKPTKVTISIGIAQLKNNENITSWFIRADEALLKSKRTGKDRFSIALR